MNEGVLNRAARIVATHRENLRFLPRKPRVLARIARNYPALLLGRPRLRTVTLALTYACQLSCTHCSAKDRRSGKEGESPLSPSRLAELIEEIEACGAVNIHFTGGDPLLSRRLWEMADLIGPKRFILSLVTNGLLLPKKAAALRRAGFDLVIVSIDSADPETHDRIRGFPGLHRRAWDGVDEAVATGLQVMVAMVATPRNLDDGDLDRMIETCRRRAIPLQILPARKMGMWQGEKEVELSPRQKARYFELVRRPGVRWDGQSSYLSPRCLAARERLYIDTEGDVFPCDFCARSFGNIRQERLGVIWKRMVETPPFHQAHGECLTAFGPDTLLRETRQESRDDPRPDPHPTGTERV